MQPLEVVGPCSASQRCCNYAILARRQSEGVLVGGNGDSCIQLATRQQQQSLGWGMANGASVKRFGVQRRWSLNSVINIRIMFFIRIQPFSYQKIITIHTRPCYLLSFVLFTFIVLSFFSFRCSCFLSFVL